MADVRKDILFANGRYVEGQYEFEQTAYWPLESNKEISSDAFGDLRKHMFLSQHPAAGYYAVPYDTDVGDLQDEIDAAIAAYDPEFGDQLAFKYGDIKVWGTVQGHARTFVCISTLDDVTEPATGLTYGISKASAYASSGAWDNIKPPDHINPSLNVWETSNDHWALMPDYNLYSDLGKYSPVCTAIQDRPGGSTHTYLHREYAFERLPEEINIDKTHDGLGNNASGGQGKNRVDYLENRLPGDIVPGDFTRFHHDKKEIDRRHITQIESMGTAHDPDRHGLNDTNDVVTAYIYKHGQPDGNFHDSNPMDPIPNPSSPTYSQFLHEPKICAAYQNQIIFLLEMLGDHIALPVDEDYKRNFVAYQHWFKLQWNSEPFAVDTNYRGQGSGVQSIVSRYVDGEWKLYRCIYYGSWYYATAWEPDEWEETFETWDPEKYPDQEEFAAINEPYWACNESAFECMLKYTGKFDWWFDTKHVYMPTYIQEFRHKMTTPASPYVHKHLERTPDYIWENDYTGDEIDTMFPRAIGTWRRCFRYCFGRVDQREAANYNSEANGVDYHTLTKTLMRPKYWGTPIPDGTEWKQLYSTLWHWWGDNDDCPTRGPGEHPAEFEYAGVPSEEQMPDGEPVHKMPWPGEWKEVESEWEKLEMYVGHNWDGLLTRPAHLPYFEAGVGENYYNYVDLDDNPAEPDDDGRPVFDYEQLKVEYDKVDHGDLDEDEEIRCGRFITMFKRHDPSQIVDGVAQYEIQYQMLNDMRLMLLYSRGQLVEVPQGIHELYGWAVEDEIGSGDNWKTFVNAQTYLDYFYGIIDTEEATTGWVEDSHETMVGEGICYVFDTPPDSWANYGPEEEYEPFGNSGLPGSGSTNHAWRSKQRYKIPGVEGLGLLNSDVLKVRVVYWSEPIGQAQCGPSGQDIEQQTFPCEFQLFMGESEELVGDPITVPLTPMYYDSEVRRTYMEIPGIEFNDLEAGEFLIIGAKHLNPPIVPWTGGYDTRAAFTEVHVQFDNDMLIVTDANWNLLHESVLGTPNDKGLKQREVV